MAGAVSLLNFPAVQVFHRLQVRKILASAITTPSFSIEITKRRNYLRPKILKTLTKPYPSDPLAKPPTKVLEIETTDSEIQQNGDEMSSVTTGEADKVEEVHVEETSGVSLSQPNIGAISSKDFVKYGMYLVGFFVFQTICSVWILGNGSSTDKDADSDSLSVNGIDKRIFLLNGIRNLSSNSNCGTLNESEFEEKIAETRSMAKKCREKVKDGKEGVQENGIGNEIDNRLARLERRLKSKREKLPGSFNNLMAVSDGGEDEISEEEVESDEEENDKMFIFEKKLKFKSPSINQRSKPKGFTGSYNKSDVNDKTLVVEPKKLEPNNDSRKKSNGLKQNVNGYDKERSRREARIVVEAAIAETRTGSSKQRVREKPITSNKQPILDTDLWWLKLPYVLAILMRRDIDNDGPEGFFSLSSRSDAEDDYVVAFEDRSDANNFCFILDSFFEHLGDCSADIVPMPPKELYSIMNSSSKKAIVVKKGQLKLYAGQPLDDVEMALRSLAA